MRRQLASNGWRGFMQLAKTLCGRDGLVSFSVS
jgi:hypothetical protein